MTDKTYSLQIKQHGTDVVLNYDFAMTDEVFERWVELKFQFKVGKTGLQTGLMSMIPSKMIIIKERWYHRLYNWLIINARRMKDANEIDDHQYWSH